MKHFKVKKTGICYISVSEGKLVRIIKPTSNVMLICLEVKLYEYKFQQCVEMVKC